ncbi:MAG: F-type H+-transporting ATPase subunit a [Actinomycetota bacterium]|jgi:F-type H+-transporting ATPase subunit a|nr:F-type H+-transporting ATPase subunit a [Actinomycetota bacterium]
MNALLLAVDVPPISHVTIWGSGPLGFNKTAAIYLFATLATILLFVLGTRRKDALVPSGILQNSAESGVAFVRNQIIMQTMGTDGLRYLPYLTALFFFIFFSNITEIIPFVQFPANARFGMPLVLALLTWVIFNVVGVVKQGPLHYLKNSLVPPGVPKAILPLVMIIELVSTFLVRPFSLMVRLFANMLAGHLILVTFGALCAALFAAKVTVVILPFSFLLLVAMTGFEILVSFLQAFIFTILTAVYIDSSMHPSH